MFDVYYENLGFYKKDCLIIYSTFISFELKRFKIIWYVTRNLDYNLSPGWSIIFIIYWDCGRLLGSLTRMITVPFSSKPRRPARPDICTYYEEFKNLNPPSDPVTFFIELKITVFVGMLIPIANVYVANNTLINPSENSNSTISLANGNKSPWWIAYPFIHIKVKNSNCWIVWSSGRKVDNAWEINRRILDF